MKSRSGFVSNSSSSSFIIGFETKPKSAAELCRLLFGNMEYIQYYDHAFRTADVSNIVFNDLKEERPASIKKIVETVKSGHFLGYPDTWTKDRQSDVLEKQFDEMFPEYKGNYWDNDKITKITAKQLAAQIRSIRRQEMEEDRAELEKAALKYVDEKIKPHMEGKKVYVLEYADDDGQGHGHIEHGGVFDSLPHVQISHH